MNQHDKKQNGFTLIELIIVIVLLGIVGAMGAGFISQAFKGFFDTDVRMEIYEEGKTAMVRMEREIHIALPNAIIALDKTALPPYDDVVNNAGFGNAIIFGEIDETKMAGVFGQYTDPPFTDSKAALQPSGTPWFPFIIPAGMISLTAAEFTPLPATESPPPCP